MDFKFDAKTTRHTPKLFPFTNVHEGAECLLRNPVLMTMASPSLPVCKIVQRDPVKADGEIVRRKQGRCRLLIMSPLS
jgi:hypothetical protein